MRPSLLLTGLAVLGLFAACYPAATCTTSCGVTFTGQDCAGYQRTESATVDAFATCDAGSPDVACAALSGWTVRVLPESATQARDDAGDRYWIPNAEESAVLCRENPGAACDGGGRIYGETDWLSHTVTLADEHWPSGVVATELVHVGADEEFIADPYLAWSSDGRACVVATARRAPLVLTGSEGGL